MNRFPLWRHLLVAFMVGAGALYAAPSFYASAPVVEIRAADSGGKSSGDLTARINDILGKNKIAARTIDGSGPTARIWFDDGDSQLAARAALAEVLGRAYVVTFNQVSTAPGWLASVGALPVALGLDLRGGVYFLLQVDAAFAARKRMESHRDELNERFTANDLGARARINEEDGALEIANAGESARRQAAAWLEEMSGGALVGEAAATPRYVFSESALDDIAEAAMEQNVETLRRRIDELGVAEPVVTRQGSDRIAVQLPGVQDTARAKAVLGRTAALELRGVDGQKSSSRALVRRAERGNPPAGVDLFYGEGDEPLFLRRRVVVSGDHITDAYAGVEQNNRPAVFLSLNPAGGERMKRWTRPRVGERLAIVLLESGGGEVISAPVIQEELFQNFQISGNMSTTEASELALLLRSGALAAPLEIVEERTVGPSLGADNIRRGVLSVIGGFCAIAVFIGLYYALFGLVSVGALAVNLLLLTALLGMVGATLTLPGLAAFALTLGMAIDANVLINERVREEVNAGKTPMASIAAGYDRAIATILDANITTLIAGISLFAFGSGPVRGFAVVLCFGILTSMFSAVQGSRSLVNLSFERRRAQRLSLGRNLLRLKKTLPLMRMRKITGLCSAVFVLACVLSLGARGLNLGVDFTGGTVLEAQFENAPPISEVRAAVGAGAGLENAPIQLTGDGQVIIKAPPAARGAQLADDVLAALKTLDGGVRLMRVEYVGPQVGEELFIAGGLALFFVCAGIALYLSARFKWRMAIGAIVANFHDVLFILGLFSIFGWEFSLPVLAAVLAILGYSVNESVVIFDRVRENFRNLRRGASAPDVLDLSITQTFSRTIITHGSTQLAVLAMLFFGGDALFFFALALTIGIVSSIYSSVLIAGPVALRLGLCREDFIIPEDKRAENPSGAVV